VIKHKNPCGAAMHPTDLVEAFRRAYAGDTVSAFGGILAFNRPVDAALAREIAVQDKFFEVIIAPAYVDDALAILTGSTKWGKNVRVLETHLPLAERQPALGLLDVRSVSGGFLAQDKDASVESSFEVTSTRQPTREEWRDLQFSWEVCRHVTSNAIVFAKDAMVVGVGAGQMSRVDSVHLAARKAGPKAKGAAMASDAFFPFPDALVAAAEAGVTAVVHPGGSIRDADVVKAANDRGVALVTTGRRHFRH
jgi:phosphoribosylaminoimidazolecarboxamide formyltransferase/IMP cyclohydrolase